MSDLKRSPGPEADRAFDIGVKAAALGGLAVIGLLYWSGYLSLEFALFQLVFLFPVYLVFVAVVLGQWLGYSTDWRNLRPVSREEAEANWKRRQ